MFRQIQDVVPGIGKLLATETFPEARGGSGSDGSTQNEEVYAGMPTAFNSKRITEALQTCIENLQCACKSTKSVRPLLVKLELCGVLCSTYNVTDLECAVWNLMFELSKQTGRFLDASFALVNRLSAQLFSVEMQPEIDLEVLKSRAATFRGEMEEYQSLFEAVDEATLLGQLPTPHAHLKAIVIALGTAYLEHYQNWPKFSARLDLIPTRFADFFASKSWAAVCARGYFYWLHLHARCQFGATTTEDVSGFAVATTPSSLPASTTKSAELTVLSSPPESVLHAAVIVRMHGRTLVQFMRQCCEQKLTKQRGIATSSSDAATEGNKENVPTATPLEETGSQAASKTTPWGCAVLSDGELLNLWQGTRLLIRGCTQVAELYTLLGNVREARAYQDELLRMGQRFHLSSCVQIALSLMAHLDLFAQRKWAFELRINQLSHINTSKTPLEEIARKRRQFPPSCATNHGSQSTDDATEATFLRPNSKVTSLSTQHDRLAGSEEAVEGGDAIHDSLSAATNPLLATNVQAFANIFPCSPVGSNAKRTTAIAVKDQTRCFPSTTQLLTLLGGYSTTDRIDQESTEKTTPECPTDGSVPLTVCVARILYGVNWAWLLPIVRLVREDVVPKVHYLPAALQPTFVEEEEEDDTQALLNAFSSLTTSPERSVKSRHPSNPMASVVQHTGETMPPPSILPVAPRRLADRRSPRTRPSARSRRTKPENKNHPILDPLSTPANNRRTRSSGLRNPEAVCHRTNQSNGDSNAPPADEEFMLLHQLGYHLAPRKPHHHPRQTTALSRQPRIDIYVDHDADESQSRDAKNSSPMRRSHSSQSSSALLDPVESCSSLAGVAPRWRNLRLASRWEQGQHRSAHPSAREPLGTTDRQSKAPIVDPTHLRSAEALASQLADLLNTAYGKLALLPIPNLLRPICQWLGLWWLGRGVQSQAARYFCQSVGIAPTTLYASILSSRLAEQHKSLPVPPTTGQLDTWFAGYCRIRECIVPNHPLMQQDKSELIDARQNKQRTLTVVQLTLIDELAASLPTPAENSAPGCVPLGLGARQGGILVATRYTGASGNSTASLRAESRVMHGFSDSGLKTVDAFDDLQVESLDSMQIQDRVRYWQTRYRLDSRLEGLLNEMRRDWFTPDDLAWLLGQNVAETKQTTTSSNANHIVLVLDRRLIYLPWEWILSDSDSQLPTSNNTATTTSGDVTFTRSFSLPLVLSHMATAAQRSPKMPLEAQFDPHQTYYVLNPEANLSFTQQMFQPLFDRLPTWRGVVGRMPTTEEVNAGFTSHDLFIYLGHGNGSHYLLHTFYQGLNAKAAVLVLGCSSGKPRREGRHEPYSTLFNHLLAGCPFVAGLLWDVTDRDMDRFTLQFFNQWLLEQKPDGKVPREAGSGSLGRCLTQAISACKLKHLVGKSVIVYGIPAEPNVLLTPTVE